MSTLKFNTFEEYNAAKLLPLQTIVIGFPIPEYNADGTLTGGFMSDGDFNGEQIAELNGFGLSLYQPPVALSLGQQANLAEAYDLV